MIVDSARSRSNSQAHWPSSARPRPKLAKFEPSSGLVEMSRNFVEGQSWAGGWRLIFWSRWIEYDQVPPEAGGTRRQLARCRPDFGRSGPNSVRMSVVAGRPPLRTPRTCCRSRVPTIAGPAEIPKATRDNRQRPSAQQRLQKRSLRGYARRRLSAGGLSGGALVACICVGPDPRQPESPGTP